MNDVQMAERFTDQDFESSLVENFEKDFLKNLSIVHNVPNSNFDADERQSIYVVKINSASTIDGFDYEISIPFLKKCLCSTLVLNDGMKPEKEKLSHQMVL